MEFDFKIDPIWKDGDILGLDLGSKYVKVVQLQKKGKLTRLAGYGKAEIPENYVIEGVISEPEKLAEFLKEFFEKKVIGSITAKRVNISLPESKIFTRVLTLPKMSEKDIAEAISWEASQIVPMPLNDLYLDWQIIGPSKTEQKSIDIIFAAAPKSIVNSYLQLFKAMELLPVAIETSLNAVARVMIPSKKANESILVIDLGSKTINMAIIDDVIRVTGSTLLDTDETIKRITAAVESRGNEDGAVKTKYTGENVKNVVTSEIGVILDEISRIINYYNVKNDRKDLITRVILCGGNASIPHLADIITEKLDIPVAVANPWTNISITPLKGVLRKESPVYTNAVGLALMGVNND